MMSRTHLRMARVALGWTLKDLADRAKVNLNTISRYEAGGSMLSDTLEKIEAVLRSEGVMLIDEDDDFEPSIRIRKEYSLPVVLHDSVDPFAVRRLIRPAGRAAELSKCRDRSVTMRLHVPGLAQG